MNQYLKLFQALILFIGLVSVSTLAKTDQPMIMLRGKITGPHASGAMDLLFEDEGGSGVRSRSTETGTYQAVLRSGKRYTVTITDEDLQRFSFTYDSPSVASYQELTKDFEIQPVVVDAPVQAIKAKKKTKSKKTTRTTK